MLLGAGDPARPIISCQLKVAQCTYLRGVGTGRAVGDTTPFRVQVPPSATPLLAPQPIYHESANHSPADLAAPDPQRFPALVAALPGLLQRFTLEVGGYYLKQLKAVRRWIPYSSVAAQRAAGLLMQVTSALPPGPSPPRLEQLTTVTHFTVL